MGKLESVTFFGQPESFLCLGGEESIIEPCFFLQTKMEFSHLYEEKDCTFDGSLGWNPLKKDAGHAFYIGDFFVEKVNPKPRRNRLPEGSTLPILKVPMRFFPGCLI